MLILFACVLKDITEWANPDPTFTQPFMHILLGLEYD